MPQIDVNIRDAVQIELKDSKEPVIIEQERKDVEIQISESSPDVLVEHRPRKSSIIIDDSENSEILDAIETAKKAYKQSVEAINIANNAMQFAGTLRVYTLEEYNALKQAGRLENKMYCIYTNGILTRIYIYRTLIAKRANEGQIATGSTFPFIFPIIFA